MHMYHEYESVYESGFNAFELWFSANISKITKPTFLQICRSYCYGNSEILVETVLLVLIWYMPIVSTAKHPGFYSLLPNFAEQFFVNIFVTRCRSQIGCQKNSKINGKSPL